MLGLDLVSVYQGNISLNSVLLKQNEPFFQNGINATFIYLYLYPCSVCFCLCIYCSVHNCEGLEFLACLPVSYSESWW